MQAILSIGEHILLTERRFAIVEILLAASMWGAWSLFLRPANWPPQITSFIMLAIVGVTSLPFARRDASVPIFDRTTFVLIALNAICDATNVLAFFGAIQKATVAIAVLTHYFAPVLVALAAPFIDKVRIKGAIIAALFATAGLALVLEPWRVGEKNAALGVGAVLGLLSAVAYASNIFIAGKLSARIGVARAQGYHAIVSAALLVPFALSAPAFTWSATSCTLVVLGSLLPGTLGGLIFVHGLRVIGSATASLLAYVEPLVAVTISVLVFHEHLSPYAIVGAPLVLGAGMYVVRASANAEQLETQNSA